MPFIAISLYLFVKNIVDKEIIKKLDVFFIGLCCSIVLLLKPNLISLWICMAIYILITYLKKKKYKELSQTIITFLLGVSIPLIIVFIYLGLNGTIKDFFDQYIFFNFTYATNKTKDQMTLIQIINTFINSTVILTLCVAILFGLSLSKNKKNKHIYIFNLCYLLLTFILIIMPKIPFNHYAMIIIPAFIIPITLLTDFIFKINTKRYGITLVLIIIALYPKIYQYTQQISTLIKHKENNELYRLQEKIIKQYIKGEDKLLVFGNEAYIYIRNNQFTNIKYFYQIPVIEVDKKYEQEFIQQINIKKPKLIICEIEHKKNKVLKQLKKEYRKVKTKDTMHIYYLRK